MYRLFEDFVHSFDIYKQGIFSTYVNNLKKKTPAVVIRTRHS